MSASVVTVAKSERREVKKKKSVWKNWINLGLLLVPVVFFHDQIGEQLGFDWLKAEGPVLAILAALTLFPLSAFLESAVEELSELLGQYIGGLLHTTFDNAAELVIALSVLLAGGPNASTLVLGSVAGVVVRNSLLVLGVATIAGAMKHGPMRFNPEEAGQFSSFFALAVTGICLPTVAFFVARANFPNFDPADLKIFGHYSVTLGVSVALLLAYIAYILFNVFHLRAEENLYEKRLQKREERRRKRLEKQQPNLAKIGADPFEQPSTIGPLFQDERLSAEARSDAMIAAAEGKPLNAANVAARAEEEAEEANDWLHQHRWARILLSVVILAVAAAGIVNMSEAFAKSIEIIGEQFHDIVNPFFLGLIVIPVVGGAVQLIGATNTAREEENKIELVMGITSGASIQMVTVVVPVLVIVGYLTNHALLLNFNPLEVIIFVAASFLFMLLSRDGESTILEGVQLCSLWALLAATAFFLPPPFVG